MKSITSMKCLIEKSILIQSKPDQIFSVLKDLKHWNQWTNSITDISYTENNPVQVGSRIKIQQPKLLPAIWTITEVVENKTLVWEKNSWGLKMTANHFIEVSNGETLVRLQIIFQGFLANLFYRLFFNLIDKYLTMEILGLKEKCER